MNSDALNDDDRMILRRMRRGDQVYAVACDAHVSERTMSRRLAHIRKVLNDFA